MRRAPRHVSIVDMVLQSLFRASTCARIPLAPEARHLVHPPAEGSRWAATETMRPQFSLVACLLKDI